jgi:hypothetical protein
MTGPDKQSARAPLTDLRDLEEQLFREFAGCPDTDETNRALTKRAQELTRPWRVEISRVMQTREANGRPILRFELILCGVAREEGPGRLTGPGPSVP